MRMDSVNRANIRIISACSLVVMAAGLYAMVLD
jgi:hypothetical protein